MRIQSSSRRSLATAAGNRSRPSVVLLLTAILQIVGGALQTSVAGPPIRGTPIDSPPETNATAPPADMSAKSGPSELPATDSLPHPTAVQTNKSYLEAGFDKLSGFPAEVLYEQVSTNGITFARPTTMKGQIPDAIRTLDNRKVAAKGFMLPLREEKGLTDEFILLRSRMMCCFGVPPGINEWIHVRVSGPAIKCIMDTPVTILGTLHVGEYRENRAMLGIYRLDAEKLEGPPVP